MTKEKKKTIELGGIARAVRHPIRIVALALAALSVTSGIAGAAGILSAIIGVVLGVITGEKLGRSRYRLPVVIAAHLAFLVVFWGLAWATTFFGILPSLLGPSSSLVVDVILRFFATSFCVVSCFRAVAVRRPTAMAIELLVLAAALSLMFAAHRDAVIERPLWLSDWAWRHGYDPSQVLLAIGAVAVVVLAGLLLAESRRKISLASVLLLPVLALLAMMLLGVSDLRQPEVERDLGLTESVEGDEPNPTPPGHAEGGNEPRRDGGGSRGEERDGGRSGGGGDERPDGGSQTSEQDGSSTAEGDEQDGGGSQDEGERDGGSSSGDERDGGGRSAGDAGLDGGSGGGGEDGGRSVPAEGEEGEGGQCSQEERDQNDRQPSSQRRDQDRNQPDRSPAPMAIVLLEDDYSPESQAYYFRQDVWSEYNGSRLVASRRADADLDVLREFPTLRTRVRQTPPVKGRTLVHARVALLTDHNHPFALESPVVFEPISNPNPTRFERAYRFESLAQTVRFRDLVGRRLGDPSWSDELRQHYLQGPADPRYEALAQEIVGQLPPGVRDDAFTQALAVKLYLDQEMTYSTRERHANQPDPTAHMLFGNRIGYCVHFAHAAVYLWRSLGIPARVGTGYHSPEDNRRGSVILLRSNDGHAWPELWVEGVGWVVMDIAPARNLDPPAQPLDEDLQELLGDMARENPPEPLEPPNREPLFPNLGRNLAAALVGVLIFAFTLLYVVKLWRRLVPIVEGPQHMPRVGFRLAIDLLNEAGFVREHGETREAFASRTLHLVPAFRQLTAWNVAARLADPSASLDERAEFRVANWRLVLGEFKKQLRRNTSFVRRFLGLLNPVSFFFSR